MRKIAHFCFYFMEQNERESMRKGQRDRIGCLFIAIRICYFQFSKFRVISYLTLKYPSMEILLVPGVWVDLGNIRMRYYPLDDFQFYRIKQLSFSIGKQSHKMNKKKKNYLGQKVESIWIETPSLEYRNVITNSSIICKS